MFSRVTPKYWALLALLAWGATILGLEMLRLNSFGLDEGAARALLLNWSVFDRVATPIVMHGSPDLRAILFIPLGLYWPGSILAAKVFTLLIMFTAVLLFYRWSCEQHDRESALIASGLLLIAPLTLTQVDHIGAGPYLLAGFGLGMLIDQRYRSSERVINSWYFAQLLVIALSISIHPIGLAYPLALLWHWYKHPLSTERRKSVFVGVAITLFVVAIMQIGWVSTTWMQNPLQEMGHAILGGINEDSNSANWTQGLIPAALLLFLLIRDHKQLLSSLLGTTLVMATIIGLFSADASWILILLALLLYRGIPALIHLNQRLKLDSFLGQRGITLLAVFLLATLFMQNDRAYASRIQAGIFSPIDQLLQALTIDAELEGQHFQAASQWPSRTMMITKRDTLPLPPAMGDNNEFIKMTQGITHLVFDHNNKHHSQLAARIAALSSYYETIELQQGGVLLKVRDNRPPSDLNIDVSEQATHP